MSNIINAGSVSFGGDDLPIIAGPCVIESKDHSLFMADTIAKICTKVGMQFVFKSSFDKANRSAVGSFRGPNIDAGLRVLSDVKNEVGVPVLTDVHLPDQCTSVGEVVDVLQIPAFLCRQTDLLIAAGETGKLVNIKKGQFLAPGKMIHAIEKVKSTGNDNILLTERGASFGYDLVSDMRSIPVMKETDYPVVFDATHSAQMPGSGGSKTGGAREFIPTLTKAAVAAGADGVFMEVHDNVDAAKSDAATQWPLDQLEDLLMTLKNIHEAVNG